MENFNPKIKSPEKGNSKLEKFLKNFFNRHIATVVLSAILSFASEKLVQAGQQVAEGSIQTNQASLELERRDAFSKMKATIEEGDIVGKLDKLKKVYGPALDEFLTVSRIDTDLRFFNKLENGAKESNDFVNKSGANLMTMGSIVSDAYHKRWKHNEYGTPPAVSLKNIDKVPGFSTQDLKDFLKNTYPLNYVSRSISEIEFSGQSDVNEKEKTETLGQAEVFGVDFLAKNTSGDLRTSLKINLPTTGIDKESFLYVLSHELGHIDWSKGASLTSAERIVMLSEASERASAQNRYQSSYVEGINLANMGSHLDIVTIDHKIKEQYLNYVRTTEYWAEINRAYFEDTNKFQKEHPADFELVKKWIEVLSR